MTMRFARDPFRPLTGALVPADEPARAFIFGLALNEEVLLERIHERDMFEQRKIFAQLGEVADALGVDAERLRAELLYETGNCKYLGEVMGRTLICVNSMSPRAMSNKKLLAFWEKAKQVISDRMLPRIKDPNEREQIARKLSL